MKKEKSLITRSAFEWSGVECREDNGKKIIRGYAAVWEQLSVPIYGIFKEKIRSGAFANSLKKNNVRALWNHNSDMVLGSTKAGTMTLSEDDKGLRFEITLPNTQAGNDAYTSISRGDVDGMSFGFKVRKQEWDESDPKNLIRTLIEVDLSEVSPTAFPAYPQTSVGTRSVDDDAQDLQEENGKVIAKNLNLINTKLRQISAL